MQQRQTSVATSVPLVSCYVFFMLLCFIFCIYFFIIFFINLKTSAENVFSTLLDGCIDLQNISIKRNEIIFSRSNISLM